MTDDSRQSVPVTWNVTEADLADMQAGGVAVYDIEGVAEGLPARCRVSMEKFNFLTNPGFETGDLTGWTLTELGHADQLYVEEKQTDSLDGTWHMHFWSKAAGSVEFYLEQDAAVEPGTYDFAISIMGGDCGVTEIYAYARLDGEIVARGPMSVTAWNEWHEGSVEGVRVEEGQTLSVGIYVKCQGAGDGAWGKIDGARLNSAGA